jgi:hypothetical protein
MSTYYPSCMVHWYMLIPFSPFALIKLITSTNTSWAPIDVYKSNYIVVDKHSYKASNTYNLLVFFIKLGEALFMNNFFKWKKCMNITTTLIFIVVCSIVWIDKQLLLMKYIAKSWMKVCFCTWSFVNGWIDTKKSNMMFGLIISYIIFVGKMSNKWASLNVFIFNWQHLSKNNMFSIYMLLHGHANIKFEICN